MYFLLHILRTSNENYEVTRKITPYKDNDGIKEEDSSWRDNRLNELTCDTQIYIIVRRNNLDICFIIKKSLLNINDNVININYIERKLTKISIIPFKI